MKDIFCNIYSVGRPVYFFMVSSAIAGALWFTDNYEAAGLFSIAFLITFGLVGGLKFITRVPRPKNPMVPTFGHAFPSGHAAAAAFTGVMAHYFSLVWLGENVATVVAIFFVVIALAVGISRVYLRAHTTLQVLVGFAIGIIVPLVVLSNLGLL